jgi:hypothetical protein
VLPLEGIDPIAFLLFISQPPPPQTLTRVPIRLIGDEEDDGGGRSVGIRRRLRGRWW